MSVRPPPPPRRVPPPPPSRQPVRQTVHNDSPHLQGLGTVIRSATSALPVPRPPPLPVRKQTKQEERGIPEIDLQRLLARRPPPPPRRDSTSVSPPRRRLPPPPARLPTPPPVNVASKPTLIEDTPVNDLEEESCIICHDFSEVDNHASRFPRHTVSSLPTLAYDLTVPFLTEIEKARAIFTWLHHNIAYDTNAFFSGNVKAATPESTLSSGLAVCDGYAGLYQYLLECIGIQARKVVGHGKGFGYQALAPGAPLPVYSAGHAWNCIFVDGVWRLVDPCWGSGALSGTTYNARLSPKWFDSSPVEFVKSHYPEDPSYQLLEGPISWADYISEDERPEIYGDFHDHNFCSLYMEPYFGRVEGGQHVDFAIQKRCQHFSTAEDDNYVYLLLIGDTRVPLVVQEGRWCATTFVPTDGDISLAFVRTVKEQDARGLSVVDFQTKVWGKMTMTFGVLAKWRIVY